MVSSRRNRDINEQETGVALATKLPQIVLMTTTPRGRLVPRIAALNQPCGTTFCSLLSPCAISLGSRYDLINSSHLARGESFVSLLHSALTIPHHCFSLSPKLKLKRTVDHATLSAALKTICPRFPGSHLSLPLLSPPRHSDIWTF